MIARLAALAVAALFLAGCAIGRGVTAVPAFTCPTLKQYSPAQQNAVADEIERHGDKVSNLVEFNDDYGNLREGIRIACPPSKSVQ
jgi:hypothetical protein